MRMCAGFGKLILGAAVIGQNSFGVSGMRLNNQGAFTVKTLTDLNNSCYLYNYIYIYLNLFYLFFYVGCLLQC